MRWSYAALPVAFAAATFVLLQTQCRTPIAVLPKSGIRIATYNIGWLSETSSPERKEHLRSVIAHLQPDILAMQEIQSRKALEPLFGDEWQIAILNDPREHQEEAIAVRKPLAIIGLPKAEFPDPALDQAFPGGRDVLHVMVRTPSGFVFSVYAVHFKSRSGEGGRQATDPRRMLACKLLAERLKSRGEPNVVVLGDFNDAPEDVSVELLTRQAGLENLALPLYRRDSVSFGLDGLYRGFPIEARVRGAYEENERWRGGNPKYPDDFAVTQALFDQILVAPSLATRAGAARVYSGSDALEGIGGSATRDAAGNVSYHREGSLASDHLPFYADFRVPVR